MAGTSKNISLAQVQLVEEKATLAASVGVETSFWGGQIQTRYKKSAPNVNVLGDTPGSFPARPARPVPISTAAIQAAMRALKPCSNSVNVIGPGAMKNTKIQIGQWFRR